MATATEPRLTPEQRRAIWQQHQALKDRQILRKLERRGPQTNEELWAAIYELTGYKIPRNTVCTEHGHIAPFEIFADMYFERRLDVLMIGNRGGGKTTISGFLHGACCRWKPRFSALIAGATEKQSNRAYTEFKRFTRKIMGEIIDSLKSLTTWYDGSILEVITATIKGVNGPHPHLAQFDEAELSTQQIFEEFQNMAQGDDNYPAQNLLSTTRKFAFGIVQEIVKRCDQDKLDGNTPEWDVCIFCIFETLQNVPNCGNGCGCEKVVKGRWPTNHPDPELAGKPRTFADVCHGRAGRADGFVRLEDAHRRFKRLSVEVWEAQQECLRPDPEGLVHRWFSPQVHTISTWEPERDYGSIYRCWDWGGTNPHAVLFNQVLDVPVALEDGRVLPEGTIVTFDEIYKGDQMSFTDLGIRVAERTKQWRKLGYEMAVTADICDPAGGVAKNDAANGMTSVSEASPNWKHRKTPRIESIQKHVEWGNDDRLMVVGQMAPNLIEEYSKYHRPRDRDGKAMSEDAEKVDDHALDALRMLIWYLYKISLNKREDEMPTSNLDVRNGQQGKMGKRPGMRGALGAGVEGLNELPVRTDYLHEAPIGNAADGIGRRAASPVGSRGRSSLRRARVPR